MYVIDSVTYLGFEGETPTISVAALKEIFEKNEGDLPENNLLQQLIDELEDNDGYDDIECPKSNCETTNDSDARFCKRCGTRLKEEDDVIEILNIDWSGTDSCETFKSIFVDQVVPHIKGRIEALAFYGDPDDEEVPWKTFSFVVDNGTFTMCELRLEPTRNSVPDFEAEEEADEAAE